MENSSSNLRDRLLIHLLFHLGCRISEALGITVDDIDFNHHTVTIQHLKCRIQIQCPQCNTRLGKAHAFCPKCGTKVEQTIALEQAHRRVRTLPLDDDTLFLLKDYIERGGPVTKNGKQMVFGINRHRGWQVVRGCADKAGLECLVNPTTGKRCGVSPHRLRDAFAINAVKHDDSGDGLRLLQEHLGHQSFNTTARYRKVAGDELRHWYDKLWGKDSTGG